ncbi:hypothetical protein [Blastococcus sp. CT_GayMR16]|uniref:hypothetical protein n=1 Tax=Blastococcus sp. CT_GayMR16 TaxID=2559607 RepID=UPI001073996E|nr:hypothetical protein [Blastococcus sp. CT_GayMR16]TFV85844.1 hypothetical protein E4P38_18985 [Blastococcus sp. CT_GayMR16]
MTADREQLLTQIDAANVSWDGEVQGPAGSLPVEELLVRRLVELELHHTDLDAGYGAADWPRSFAEMELGEPVCSQRAERAGRAASR